MSLPEAFINYLTFEKRFSDHTIIAYKKDLDDFLELMAVNSDEEILDLNHRDLRKYLVELVEKGFENTTINRKLSSIKTFYRFLRQNKKLDVNPSAKVKSLKQKKVLPSFVPQTQLWSSEIFLQHNDDFLNKLDELILELLYQTGIRLSELINLKEKDVSKNSIKVLGKRNKERIIPISEKLFILIENFRSQKSNLNLISEFLIIQKNKKKLSPKIVYNKVNYYLGLATNLSKKSPHVLRHTFATHMLNNGASLESIKSLLGHVDLSATQIYTHNSFAQIKSIYNQSHPRGAN